MPKAETARVAETEPLIGSTGDDRLLVTSPRDVDGRDGFDIIAFDFTTSDVAIHLDLSGLWTGSYGTLNTHRLFGIEDVGAPGGEGYYSPVILGSSHSDVLIVGADYPQWTILYGQEGNDLLVAGDDAHGFFNYLNGGSGDDRLIGGADFDALAGEGGRDHLRGGGGNDWLIGGSEADELFGDDGDDVLWGEAGKDRLFGGAGDDRIDAAYGSDLVHGGEGSDTVEYWGSGAVMIDLRSGFVYEMASAEASADGEIVATDRLVSIENAVGGLFADWLIGNDEPNRLDGGSGGDRLEGRGGADVFVFTDAATYFGSGSTILDFDSDGGDRIDLSAMDAIADGWSNNQSFTFIGSAAFSGSAGELRVAPSERGWQVRGDVDGDAVADFDFYVVSQSAPIVSDFIL